MKIMIIGGTRGIGLALARHYLEAGAQVAICGRNPGCVDPQLGLDHPQLAIIGLDITDAHAVRQEISAFAADGLDLLIVTAGFYASPETLRDHPEAGIEMLNTNVLGLCHAFDAAAEIMCAQRHGQLVAVASIAGLLREYPGMSLYSICKRTVIDLCATYRKAFAPFDITVSTIIPGYIDTARLSELNGGDARRKPFLCSESQAVLQITRAITRRLDKHVFPWQLHCLIRVFNALPTPLRQLRKK